MFLATLSGNESFEAIDAYPFVGPAVSNCLLISRTVCASQPYTRAIASAL